MPFAAKFHIFRQIAKMDIAICIVPVSPMRKEGSHRAEMVSQLLFGERVEVLASTKDFLHIRNMYDGYEGWCQSGQLAITNENWESNNALSDEWVSVIDCNGAPMHISLGSPLDVFKNDRAVIGKLNFACQGNAWNNSDQNLDADGIERIAMQYINTPYLWGGRSVFGIDCSGFVQQVFRFLNIVLPRDAYQQVEKGEVVGFLAEAYKADLAFFDNEEGRIVHVGILLGPDSIIHAAGKVRVDKIDSLGIVNSDTGERTHKLRVIKRIWPVNPFV